MGYVKYGRNLSAVVVLLILLLLATASCQETIPDTANPPETGPTSGAASTDSTTLSPTSDSTPPAAPLMPSPTPAPPAVATPAPATPSPASGPTAPPNPSPSPTRPAVATPTPFPEYTIEDLHAAELAGLLSVLDESSTVEDLFQLLTGQELDCWQNEVGERAYEKLASLPALAFATSPHLLLTSCIDVGRLAEVTVAVIADAVGPLQEDEELCLRVNSSYSFLLVGSLLTGSYIECVEREIQAEGLIELFRGLLSLPVILGRSQDTVGKLISFLRSELDLECVHEVYNTPAYRSISYDEFQALPPLTLINIPQSLSGCGSGPSAFEIIAALITRHSGATWPDSQKCIVMEFEKSPTSETTIRLPEWRLESAYFKCLTEAEYQTLAVAQLEAFTGELPEERASCAGAIAADGYGIAKAIEADVRTLGGSLPDYDAFPYLFYVVAFSLCLSSDQIARIFDVPASEIIEWTPAEEHCVRTVYQNTVKQLWSEIERQGWTVVESESLAEYPEKMAAGSEMN